MNSKYTPRVRLDSSALRVNLRVLFSLVEPSRQGGQAEFQGKGAGEGDEAVGEGDGRAQAAARPGCACENCTAVNAAR